MSKRGSGEGHEAPRLRDPHDSLVKAKKGWASSTELHDFVDLGTGELAEPRLRFRVG